MHVARSFRFLNIAVPFALLVASSAVQAQPVSVLCRYYEDNRTPGKYGPLPGTLYVIDPQTKTVTRSPSTPMEVKQFDERQIVVERKLETFNTNPPIIRVDLSNLDRITGAYFSTFVWRTETGDLVNGAKLSEIASKHPMWQVPFFGIYEARVAYGECEPTKQRF